MSMKEWDVSFNCIGSISISNEGSGVTCIDASGVDVGDFLSNLDDLEKILLEEWVANNLNTLRLVRRLGRGPMIRAMAELDSTLEDW